MITALPEHPAFIVDTARLRANLETLSGVRKRTGCKVLLALKGFAMWSLAPLISRYLDGVCASSPWEARLGSEEFGGEVHTFAAAYSQNDIQELLKVSTGISFNSFSQWQAFRPLVEEKLNCGLRINPQCSTQPTTHAIYDPCSPCSRLGITVDQFLGRDLTGISGLHFHTLCEQGAEDLEITLKAVEEKFGSHLAGLEWFNFGGGHHITKKGYNLKLLCHLVENFQARHRLSVYLEPGEAVALGCGVLICQVLDVVHNELEIAILNISCTAHMPDVLEMPYRPDVSRYEDTLFPDPSHWAAEPGMQKYTYRLAGSSCLAGDVIGDYSFSRPLQPGDRLLFMDMAHYTMVKTTMFNGVYHPDIALYDSETGELQIIRKFTYQDFKARLS